MTGSFSSAPFAGVQTLRYRQSSLWPGRVRGGWRGFAENNFVCFTPVHGCTGAGGLHRRSPIGGAANGMPRKTRSPSCCSPEIYPASVFTTRELFNGPVVRDISVLVVCTGAGVPVVTTGVCTGVCWGTVHPAMRITETTTAMKMKITCFCKRFTLLHEQSDVYG